MPPNRPFLPPLCQGTMEDFDAPSSRSHHRLVRVGADSRRSSGTNVPKPHAAAGVGGGNKAAADGDGHGDGGQEHNEKEKGEEGEGHGGDAAGGEASQGKAGADAVESGRGVVERAEQDPDEALAEALAEAHIEAGRKGRGKHRRHKGLGLGEQERPRLRLLQGGDDEDEMGLCGGLGLGEDD